MKRRKEPPANTSKAAVVLRHAAVEFGRLGEPQDMDDKQGVKWNRELLNAALGYAEAVARTNPAVLTDLFVSTLTSGTIQWCRARVLHVLAQAAKQHTLDEVIDELLDDSDNEVLERLLAALVRTGWLKSPDDRLVP